MKEKCIYPLACLVWVGILLFLFKVGSRRNIKFALGTEAFARNIHIVMNLARCQKEHIVCRQEKVPHEDTVNYLLERISPEEISRIREEMMRTLIRNKVFVNDRLFKHYIIVVDGTRSLQFKEKHCEHCLKQKIGEDGAIYYHPVLEAKLVTPGGMAFSIATEFIENDGKENSVCV